MTQNPPIHPWYKSSPLWPIPQDWEVVSFNDVAKIDSNSLPANTDPNYSFYYISLSDIDSELLDIETSKQVFKTAPSRARKIVKKWDILMSTVRPNLQWFSIVRNEVKDLIASTWFAVISCDKCINEFLFQFLFSNIIQKQFYQLIVWSNYPAINSSDVKSLKFPLPPLPEQTAIATILSNTDTAIQQTQEIIRNLELRNKGFGQKLLNNKKREHLPLKSFAKEISKKNKNDEDLTVLSCTKHNWLVPSLEYFGKRIFSNDLTTYKTVPLKCFAYATNHIEEWSIWYQDKYENSLISPMYTVFQTDENINDYFLFKLLKSHKYIHEYQKRMEWSIDRRWGLRREEFAKIKVPVPSLEEQEKVMLVLDKATQQLNQHKQKLTKLQTLKKWLMQQLLTWKVRTVKS